MMSTEEIIAMVANVAAERDSLSREVERLRISSLNAEKFYDSALTTQMVAALHGVTSDLVRKYIRLGYIETHPASSEAKLLVRGSTALMLDFRELRHKAIYG